MEREYKRRFVPAEDNMQREEWQSRPANKRPKEEDTVDAETDTKPKRTWAERRKENKESKKNAKRYLRQWLNPKTATNALHCLQGPGMVKCVYTTVGQQMKAEIVTNNAKYAAMGSSKIQAKELACEMALRDLAIPQISRMRQQQRKQVVSTLETTPDASEVEDDDEDDEKLDRCLPQLAAFALYKLLVEWAPDLAVNNDPGPPKVKKTCADLPADAARLHPTSLLDYMRPNILFKELVEPNNDEFTVVVAVDGMKFIGHGSSKRCTRKAAAIAACETLFDVEFDGSVL